MRANYQEKNFRSSILAPSAGMHGWIVLDSGIDMKWMTLPIAPDTVLKYVHCNCKKKSSCKKAFINCTELYQCCECSNRPKVVQDDESDCDTSDSESDEL